MDLEKVRKEITKEEFLNNEEYTHKSRCPHYHGLEEIDMCLGYRTCKDCWEQAIEKGNVKFKNNDDEKVIESLKNIKKYCKNKFWCTECKYHDSDKNKCGIRILFENNAPDKIDIEKLTKKKVKVYRVEHVKNGLLYDFVSDEELELFQMVVCDTIKGKSYGKIISIVERYEDDYKKCWLAK